MDNYLKQKFKINFLKIGIIANSGVLQIGVGAKSIPKGSPIGYTTIGGSIVSLMPPPAVPLQSSARDVTKSL